MNNMISYIRLAVCSLAFSLPASGGVVYVDADARGVNSGTSWTDAYALLSTAIEKTSAQDEIWVAEGTYAPVRLKTGVKVIGGFAGTETAASESDPDAHKTYVSGSGRTRALESVENESSTVLRGFYIVDGFIDVPNIGGGLLLKDSDAMFVNCVFTRNRSVAMGGAVAIRGGSPTFVNCRFHGNDGGWGSGAVFNRTRGTTTFVNCLFYENTAWETGAITVLTGTTTFLNCTITDNHATKGKAGALFDVLGKAVLRNCILWNNTSPVTGAEEIHNNTVTGADTTVAHSNVKGGWSGTRNLGSDVDPLFVDPANDDYRLQAGSPCRNAGHSASLPADVADIGSNGNKTERIPKDLALKPRVEGDSVDMGAFEWHPPGG